MLPTRSNTARYASLKEELMLQAAARKLDIPDDKIEDLMECLAMALQCSIFTGRNPKIAGVGMFQLVGEIHEGFEVVFTPDPDFAYLLKEGFRKSCSKINRKKPGSYFDAIEYTRRKISTELLQDS